VLAQQLLVEAREGAQAVEGERKNQIDCTLCEVHNCLTQLTKTEQNSTPQMLAWILETQPVITQVNFGSVTNVLASVESPTILDDLHKHDAKEKYVDKASNLYFGNINAKLPAPDDDLLFHFASLPAQINNLAVPPRLVDVGAFVKAATIFEKDNPLVQKPTELPSAVQVIGTSTIKNGKDTEMRLRIAADATACGALEAP
jgi:hypothetical protein